ncbi:hypothetical protein [Atopomonas sediminilitoris]|uniref:hypothetical protein n=1 Tax=Atopomonas sediminilitoris TaxID=2919919 RepID=UPI001F4E0EA5|nr:hypothetical protein [Atopomonas sediminilitoris]MCJ8170783.1 hypothetical protein [Atopomonas sediminilitoris]
MALPTTPRLSTDPLIAGLVSTAVNKHEVFSENINHTELLEIVQNQPHGVLMFVYKHSKSEYKIYCANALRLHYCKIKDCLAEIYVQDYKDGSSAQAWAQHLTHIKYYKFLPCDLSVDIERIKDQVCSHITKTLLDSMSIDSETCRSTTYFYSFHLSTPDASTLCAPGINHTI